MTVDDLNGVRIITFLTSQIDALNSEELRERLFSQIGESTQVLIDLSEVQFIDSSGLGVLLALVRIMHDRGGSVVFCSARPPVQALFRMVRLATIVTIYETRDDALAALSA